MEPFLHRSIQPLHLRLRIARRLRIEVDDIAIRCIQLHVHALELVQTLRKQSRAHQ